MDGEARQSGAGPDTDEADAALTATTAEEAMTQRPDPDDGAAQEALAEQAYAPQPAAVGVEDHLDDDLAEQLRHRRDRDVRDA